MIIRTPTTPDTTGSWVVANDTVVDASDNMMRWLHKPLADLLQWFKDQDIVWSEE